MRRSAALLLLAIGCGSRRVAPSPATRGAARVDVGELTWADGMLTVPFVRPASRLPEHLESLDWSATAGEWGVAQEAVPLGLTTTRGVVTAWQISVPAPVPPPDTPVVVAGTVHIRHGGGIRSAEVFRTSPRLAVDRPDDPSSAQETP